MTDLHHEVSGSGPAVVLVHSGVTDSRMWDEQVALLAPRFTVARYDLRGFGESPFDPGVFSNLDDLRGLFDELGIERAALVGNSLGGRIALEFALEHSERVTRLVLVAAGLRDHDWSENVRRFGQEEEALLGRGDLDGVVELNLRMWALPEVRERVRPMQRRAVELQAGVEAAERPLQPPASHRLGDVSAPTLVIDGDRDVHDFRELADRFAREIPGARLEVIAGAGHLPSLERPDEFNRLLLDFLAAPS